jgi:plastocyanin
VNSTGSIVGSSGALAAGDSFDMVFVSSGEYVCSDALNMGQISMRVVASSSLSPSSSSTAATTASTLPLTLTVPWGKPMVASVYYVQAGATVTWMMSVDDNTYTITSPLIDGVRTLNSGLLFPGDHYSYTFTQPGSYPFVSRNDPSVFGTVVVLPADTVIGGSTTVSPTADGTTTTYPHEYSTLSSTGSEGGSMGIGLQLGLLNSVFSSFPCVNFRSHCSRHHADHHRRGRHCVSQPSL